MPSNTAKLLRRLSTVALVAIMLVTSAWATPKFHVMHAFAGGNDAWGPNGVLTLDSAVVVYGQVYVGGQGTTTQCTANGQGSNCGMLVRWSQP